MKVTALLDPYQAGRSLLHRAPAGIKLAIATTLILAVIMLPRSAWVAHLLVAGGLVTLAALSAIAPRQLLLRLLWLEPFALGIALLALFGPGGGVLFASMLLKSSLCLAVMLLLTATTRFTDLLRVLWALRLPGLLVTTLALMYRYLFVLAAELERMRRARSSRLLTDSSPWSWQHSSAVAGQLFVRSTERAERVYQAMCARGWKT